MVQASDRTGAPEARTVQPRIDLIVKRRVWPCVSLQFTPSFGTWLPVIFHRPPITPAIVFLRSPCCSIIEDLFLPPVFVLIVAKGFHAGATFSEADEVTRFTPSRPSTSSSILMQIPSSISSGVAPG